MLKDLVLRILNQTVGEYFENIDSSQFQISVFSGNIALNDLILKPNVCESLGLPFSIIAGRCSKLTVKIPWTSLRSQPVEVEIKDLFLLIVPGSTYPYDKEAEEKTRLRLKLQLLENIEAAQNELASNSTPSDLAEPGYFEKLGMQIVRNVHLRVDSIHIRYEDGETNPNKSFAVGAVLNTLSILTTDEEWTPRYVNDNSGTVHKLLSLEGLGFYWDCNSCMVSKTEEELGPRVALLKEMLQHTKFDNLVGPISITTRLRLNMFPERGPEPFKEPKVLFVTVMEELVIGISSLQFQDMLYMAAAWEGLLRKECYRKYRPHRKPCLQYPQLWWKYAIDCVMEDNQRQKNDWRWIRMRHHRRDCRAYHMALYTKNILRRLTPELEMEIEELESRLDIFNILLIRKQADLCRLRQQKIELKLRREQTWCGWLKGLVISPPIPKAGGGCSRQQPLSPKEMSPEEKRSLLVAVGYTNPANLVAHVPPEYVEARVDYRLDKLKFIITQDDRRWIDRHSICEGPKSTILDLTINEVTLGVDFRPENSGITLECHLGSIDVYGGDAPTPVPDPDNNGNRNNEDKSGGGGCGCDTVPHLVAPRRVDCGRNFLDLKYDKAPVKSIYEQRLWIHGHPLDITYDSATIEKLTACFTLPPNIVALERLQSKAMMTYSDLKARSSTSLKKIMSGDQQDNFEMDIHIEAPCLIIPQNCFGPSILSVTVVEMGEFIVTSQLLQL